MVMGSAVVGPPLWWGFVLMIALLQVADQALAVRRRRDGRLAWGPWKATTQSGRIAILAWFCVGTILIAAGFIVSLL